MEQGRKKRKYPEVLKGVEKFEDHTQKRSVPGEGHSPLRKI